MINDIITEIINHLSPISTFIFSMTNHNINKLCQQNINYQIFKSNIVKIGGGSSYSMIIKDNHLYQCGNIFNMTYLPTLLYKNVISVHCGEKHCIFITNKDVYGLGCNYNGQLGFNELRDYDLIKLNFNIEDILNISCGGNHSMILTTKGLYGFGHNLYGQLGLPLKIYTTPTIVNHSYEQILQVCCGYHHTILRTKNKCYGFGNNKSGQLGLPYHELIWDCQVLKISCGLTHTVFLTKDGAYGLGSNICGQLGLGDKNFVYKPTKILDNVIDIDCGDDYTLFLTHDGLYGCGCSYYGNLKSNKTQYLPIKLKQNIKSFACGSSHILFKTQYYYGLGSNKHSQLGLGKYKNKKYIKPQLIFIK